MTPSRRSFRPAALAACMLLVLAAGCSAGKRLYPVEGTVVYEDGAPVTELARGTVSLQAVEDKSNATGEIGPDGSFHIRTPPGRDGAAAGTYRVLILPPEGADRNRPPIDRHYNRYETSGIEVTVTEGENKLTVKVKRPNRAAAR